MGATCAQVWFASVATSLREVSCECLHYHCLAWWSQSTGAWNMRNDEHDIFLHSLQHSENTTGRIVTFD